MSEKPVRTAEDVRWDIHYFEREHEVAQEAARRASWLGEQLDALYEELMDLLDKDEEGV